MLRRLTALILVGLLVACGGDDGGDDEAQPDRDGPEVGDHWHAAFGIFACGEFLTPQNPNDPLGIHTHADGLIHIHPFEEEAAGENATLGKFFDAAGVDVDSLAEDTDCDEPGNELRLLVDGEEVATPAADLPLRDGQVIVLALAPPDAEIGEPPWAERIDDPGDV
ncbi:MAG: hypothetical protein ACRDJP_05015 [Actinomycetota bacterium]